MKIITKMTIKTNEVEKEILWNFSEALTEVCSRFVECADCPYYYSKFRNEHGPCPVEENIFTDILHAFLD